ncbi:unnamed protein product [Rhizopus stolonifer]
MSPPSSTPPFISISFMYKRQNSDNLSKWAKVLQMLSNKKHKSKSQRDELKQIKLQVIPKTIQDGPQNTWQLYYLYRITSEKLRSSPSIFKAVHLKNMIHTLQEKHLKEQEEDDVPLALIEKRQVSFSCDRPSVSC